MQRCLSFCSLRYVLQVPLIIWDSQTKRKLPQRIRRKLHPCHGQACSGNVHPCHGQACSIVVRWRDVSSPKAQAVRRREFESDSHDAASNHFHVRVRVLPCVSHQTSSAMKCGAFIFCGDGDGLLCFGITFRGAPKNYLEIETCQLLCVKERELISQPGVSAMQPGETKSSTGAAIPAPSGASPAQGEQQVAGTAARRPGRQESRVRHTQVRPPCRSVSAQLELHFFFSLMCASHSFSFLR